MHNIEGASPPSSAAPLAARSGAGFHGPRCRGWIVNLFVLETVSGWNAAVTTRSRLLRRVSIPQLLLLVAALAYGGVFALLLAFGRPGLGIGQYFYVPVILAAAGSSAAGGAVAGVGALLLYELGIHDRHGGLAWRDFIQAPALTRLAGYAAAGLLTGFLAMRGRRMLAQSLFVLEDLIDLAHRRFDDGSAD